MKRLNTEELLLCAIVALLGVIVACLCNLHTDVCALEQKISKKQEVGVVYQDAKENAFTRFDEETESVPVEASTPQNDEVGAKNDEIEAETDYVLRVLTAEAGTDELLCGCIAQALYNACEKHDWKYTPAEMMRKYQYTNPASWVSEAAERAYDEVFCCGYVYGSIGKATVFYAPQYCSSDYHESQRFVVEINGVRFFEEVN